VWVDRNGEKMKAKWPEKKTEYGGQCYTGMSDCVMSRGTMHLFKMTE
jgi:hypothetical protein